MADLWVRQFSPDDAAACAQVFYDAVHVGAAEDYTKVQRQAWVSAPPNIDDFGAKLVSDTTFVAANPTVCGFMSLTAEGVIDMAYVTPDQRGTGTAGLLYAAILNAAAIAGHTQLNTYASHLARPFFERQGWYILHLDSVIRNGVAIDRFAMRVEFA